MMWFQNLVERFSEQPPAIWGLVALLLAIALVQHVHAKRKVHRLLLFAINLFLIAGVAVIIMFFAMPADLDGAENSFLYSPVFWGTVTAAIGVAGLIWMFRKRQFSTQMLSHGAIAVAISFLLDCITLYRLLQGGSITPGAMLPIIVYAMAYGTTAGCAAGTIFGVLQIFAGAYVVHPIQFLLDYPLAFAAIGSAGFFYQGKWTLVGVLTAGFSRFLMHFISGFVFFASYVPEGDSILFYNLGYNASYLVPEILICLVILMLPSFQAAILRIRKEVKRERDPQNRKAENL